MKSSSTPERRSPRQERSRRKVQRIVAAARRLLEREGAQALNTNRIASEAQIGVGSVYDYFPNKQAIALQLIEEMAAEESAAVMDRLSKVGDDLRALIRETVTVTVELYRANQSVYRELWAMTDVARTIGHRPGERMILQAATAQLHAHRAELTVDDPELAAFTCFHLIESLAYRYVTEGRWSDARCIDETTRVIYRYLFGGDG